MTEISISHIERLDLTLSRRRWLFAEVRRAEIDRLFVELQQKKPALWNGPVLMLHEHSQDGTVFRGSFFETDFASMIAWREWGEADEGVKSCFGMGALRGSDGAFLLGVMAQHTANAGSIYFPAGLVDPRADVTGDTIDMTHSVLREVSEETGLGADDYEAVAGWYSVVYGQRIAHIKILNARVTACVLRKRILANIAVQEQPELTDIRIVASPSDLDQRIIPYVSGFLQYFWAGASQ
jgi:8-oxo-dGTP pyrophosphatase MutT (NUDIX family)